MGNSFSFEQIPDLTGKTYVITGASTGIGYVTAREIASKGGDVILCCRSESRGNDAIKRIHSELNQLNITVMGKLELLLMDLMSLNSVKLAARTLLQRNQRIDVLINNAGIMAVPFQLTEEGIESQFATNHIGHFVFTLMLLPLLPYDGHSRIINLSSDAHKYPYPNGILPIDQIQVIQPPEPGCTSLPEQIYSPHKSYGQSKLANILFTKYLAQRLPKIRCYCIHPGAVYTELGRGIQESYGSIVAIVIRSIGPILFKTPDQGAITTLCAATNPFFDTEQGNEIAPSGTYFVPQGKPSMPSALAQDPELIQRLWDMSIQICQRVLGDELVTEMQSNINNK